jgi:hypothetical protein
MESKGFSVGEMVKKGWRLMRRHTAFFVGFLLVYFILSAIPHAIVAVFPDLNEWLLIAIGLVVFVLTLVVWIGFLKAALKVVDGKRPTYKDLFSSFPIVVQFFIAWIIYSLVVIVGFILLVFPAAIWGSRYFLWPFVMIDKGTGPIESLALSGKMTMGVKWDVFMVIIATWLVMLLGLMVIFVGWFFALPVAVLAQVSMYRMLESQYKNV